MKACAVLVASSLLALAVAACASNDGFQFVNMERPAEESGLRPPADYAPCYAGTARGLDTNKDGKPDLIHVSNGNGHDTCVGSDTNHDGTIDTWDVLDDSGRLAKRSHDSNGDGRADQAWTFDPTAGGCATIHVDANGDGRPDPGSPLDVCRHLSSPGPAPAGDAGR